MLGIDTLSLVHSGGMGRLFTWRPILLQTTLPAQHGAIADSAENPMSWDLRSESLRNFLAFTATVTGAATLHIREAATEEELDAPLVTGLHHEHTKAIAAPESPATTTTDRVIVARDMSLPCGRAWLTGSGNYVLHGSAYKA